MTIEWGNPDLFWDTFNIVTLASGVICGFAFGYWAFLPLIRSMVPDNGAPPPSARQAFWFTFAILWVVLGAFVFVFYAQQIVSEIVVTHLVAWRAIGRYAAFLIFLTAFAFGVAVQVRNEYNARQASLEEHTDG